MKEIGILGLKLDEDCEKMLALMGKINSDYSLETFESFAKNAGASGARDMDIIPHLFDISAILAYNLIHDHGIDHKSSINLVHNNCQCMMDRLEEISLDLANYTHYFCLARGIYYTLSDMFKYQDDAIEEGVAWLTEKHEEGDEKATQMLITLGEIEPEDY